MRNPMSRSRPAFADLWSLPLRTALAAAMLYHGTRKLGPRAAEQTGQFFDQVGLKPGKPLAWATGVAETAAGALTVLGVGTRVAALAVLVTQAVAIAKVHAPKGFDIMKGGFEYNLALIAIAVAVLLRGPGRVSVHELLERRYEGRGPRKLLRRARPPPSLTAVRLLQ